MQKVTKEEFKAEPDYPDLFVKTNEKKFIFEEGDYSIRNDTISGKGESILLNNDYKPFEGKISINDVEKIETQNMFSQKDTAINIVLTKEKEFIFKLNENYYHIINDTIYGKGKYRFRNADNQFQGKISINDAKEIQVDKYDLTATILTGVLVVSFVVTIVAAASTIKIFSY